MSNFEKWKAAKSAWWSAECKYNFSRQATIDAGIKRSAAWEALVAAATSLSPDEREQAVEYEFGVPVTNGDRGSAAT